jgi:hypothetical protein
VSSQVCIDDIRGGDYVTLCRVDHGFLTQEIIMTFHDVVLETWRPTYACDASSEIFIEGLEDDNEEES